MKSPSITVGQVTTPTLPPLPRHEGGRISDKGEGVGGGEKWDFLYYQVKTVAQHFKRDPAVISRGIRKVEKKRRDEKPFANRVSKVEEAIKENKERKIIK